MKRRLLPSIVVAVAALLAVTAWGKPKPATVPALAARVDESSARPFLHPLFADHMVLQRDAAVPVWGWCQPGQEVTVDVAGKSAVGRAGADGRWEARLGPIGAGGPFELNVS